jgi:MFS family permease
MKPRSIKANITKVLQQGSTYIRWLITNRLPNLLRGPTLHSDLRQNIWHFYLDLIWLGVANAAITFNSVYAIRLGASEELLGWLTSIPGLLVVLLRAPAARMIEHAEDQQSLIVRGLLGARIFYLLIFLLPFLPSLHRAEVLVALIIMMGLPAILANAGWGSFFADVIPARQRVKVVSVRSTLTHLMILVIVPILGKWLDWAPFPYNYQGIYLLAFIGALVSTWHVTKVKVPEDVRARQKKPRAPAPLNLRSIWQIMTGSRQFSALLIATFAYQWAVSIASPLYNVYYVQRLDASEGWIGFRTTLASLASILAYRFWPRLIDRWGDRAILILTAPMMLFFPLGTGLARTLTPHLFIIMWTRVFGAAVMLSRYSILLKSCPEDRRPTYIATYAILVNIAAFIAPLVGVRLEEFIGINNVFFVSAALRLVSALLYLRLPMTKREAA